MTIKLRVVAGNPKDHGQVFLLPGAGTVDVGRGWTTLTRLHDLTVSRHHCRLTLTNGQAQVIDLPAEQGKQKAPTLVNGLPVTRLTLAAGDKIRIGTTELLLEADSPHDELTHRLQGLPVICQCGRELQFRPQFKGTSVPCPHCGAFVRLPGEDPLRSIGMGVRGLWLRALHNPEAPPSRAGTGLVKRASVVLTILFLAGVVGFLSYSLVKGATAGPPRQSELAP